MLQQNLQWLEPIERQKAVVARIVRFQANAEINAADWSQQQVEVRQEILQSLWNAYQSFDQEIAIQNRNNDQVEMVLESLQDEAALAYSEAKRILEGRMEAIQKQHEPKKAIKASRIVVQTFGGCQTDWPAWSAQFIAKVHNTTLEYHEKIDILAKSITGDAEACVGGMINRDKDEYDRAWAALCNRYDNEYQVVMAHLNAILNIKAATKDSEKDLRAIVDTINQQLRMLKRYDFDTAAWDPLVFAVVLRKLDADTFKEWEKLETRKKMPKLIDLLAFVERRISSLIHLSESHAAGQHTQVLTENRQRSTDRFNRDRKTQGQANQRHGHQSASIGSGEPLKQGKPNSASGENQQQSSSPPCVLCGNTHRLWNCRKFTSMSLAARTDALAKWKICPNCLIEKHSSEVCTRNGCPFCDNAKHNSCICPKRVANRVHHARGRKRKQGQTDKHTQ